MAARFYGERRLRATDDMQLERIISCMCGYEVWTIRTAIDVSSADPTSRTQAGTWLDESNQ